MDKIKLLLIAALNCVVLFFLSLPIIASDGGGGGDALNGILVFGFSCIAFATYVGLLAVMAGNVGLGIKISALALPFTFLLGMIVLMIGRALGFNIG